jgi:hypothetical protein
MGGPPLSSAEHEAQPRASEEASAATLDAEDSSGHAPGPLRARSRDDGARLDANERAELARITRRVRLLIANASGDVRAELEELRDDLERLRGPSAEVLAFDPSRRR